jgi:hypothetical protein
LLKGELTIAIGTLKLKKRRDGKGAAHKVRSRERAAVKAAKKAAEEANATVTAEAVQDDVDSEDEEETKSIRVERNEKKRQILQNMIG